MSWEPPLRCFNPVFLTVTQFFCIKEWEIFLISWCLTLSLSWTLLTHLWVITISNTFPFFRCRIFSKIWGIKRLYFNSYNEKWSNWRFEDTCLTCVSNSRGKRNIERDSLLRRKNYQLFWGKETIFTISHNKTKIYNFVGTRELSTSTGQEIKKYWNNRK